MLMAGTCSAVKQASRLLLLVMGACAGLVWGLRPSLQAQQNTSPPPPRIDPKAQELLDRTIRALGGPAFLRVKTLTTRGRAFAIEDEATVGLAPFQSFVQYPDKRRFSYGKSKPVILINNGDGAWELDQYGLITQPPEQAQRWKIANRYSLENLLRLRVREPGVLVQAGGVDFVDNVPTLGVDLTEAQGAHVTLDLDRRNSLPVRIRYRVQNPKTGEWDEDADVYGDYQNIQGVMTPMHITRYVNGDRVSETYRNSARYDEDFPASYFQPTG
jgi:hypothetical protein